MARLTRLTLAGYPHHVMLRGNNRQMIFSTRADYLKLLALLAENAAKFRVAVHAYVLMPNHFHLLVSPDSDDGLPKMMQAVGRRYVRYFNDCHGRSGTLWEGRYRSTLIQADLYLLACMAYIDLNPVRAGLVPEAKDYPWSSHSHYVGRCDDKLLSPHAIFWSLGNTPFAREAAYAERVGAGISQSHQDELTRSVLSGWALGEVNYVADLQKRTERRVTPRVAGRPRKIAPQG